MPVTDVSAFVTRTRTAWRYIGGTIVAGVAVRTAYLVVAYLLGAGGVKRIHVESGLTLFFVAGMLFAISRSRSDASRTLPAPPPLILWPLCCIGAWALYWPALEVGALSDDFVLIDRASRFDIGAVSLDLFRPLPLLLWGVILRAGGGVTGLHALNLALHGTVAYLVMRLISGMSIHRAPAIMGGIVMLTFPLATEAVVWCSGVFDLSATACVLLAVLAARRYRNGTHDGRLALYVWTCAAILSKEVALVTPVLVGIDAWCRRAASRRLVTDTAVLAAGAAVVGSIRLLFGSHLVHTHITRFMVQRWLFETFGALMLPFHLSVVPQQLIVVSTAAVLVLASACWLSASQSTPGRVLAAPVGWILVSAAPMLTFLFVSPELEGARYVYLPSVGWAALLIVGATRRDEHWWRFPASTGLLIVIACGIVATRLQLAPWTSAAATRDVVLRAAGRDHAFAGCDSVSILGLPDTVRGAYVLRNGASEAFGKPVEMRTSSSAADPCAFRWDGQAMISALHGGAMQP